MAHTRVIGGHKYNYYGYSPNKKEAQETAKNLKNTGKYRSVRVVKTLVDRRYAWYYIYTR